MARRRNLVLLGFMGTGKTTLGRRVAEKTGAPFWEMDVELERRAGKSIARIFAEDGEAAFRDMEAALAAEWGRRAEGAVIAAGGGVVLRPENLQALGEQGRLVCLTAPSEVILARTAGSTARPLLAGPDPERRIRELLAARAPFYARIPRQLDTSAAPPEELVARLIEIWDEPD